jgi:predicted nucleic acid-binding Zn ribbon protein
LKNRKESEKTTTQAENKAVYVSSGINTCIACGREIPEGMLVCMECEIGKSQNKCVICNKPVSDRETICSKCKSIILRSKKN